MKVSFCQTYGDRRKLFYIKFKDIKLLNFYNNFDYNIFSFHNSPPELIKWFKENSPIPNPKIFIHNDVPYSETIERLKISLKEIGATHLFFHQDDAFSHNNDNVNLDELFSYVTSQDDIMLSLQASSKLFNDLELHKELKTFKVYKNDTTKFWDIKKLAFDDTPYFCSINYIDKIYDESYLSLPSIWNSTHFLNDKFSQIKMNRYVTNFSLFKNYDLFGPNSTNSWKDFNELNERGLM